MAEFIPFFQGEKRSVTDKLAKYFAYSDLETKTHYDEVNDVYILSVPANKENEAKKHYQAFYFVERDRIEQEETNNDSNEETASDRIVDGLISELDSSMDRDEDSYSDMNLDPDMTSDLDTQASEEEPQIPVEDKDEPPTVNSLITGTGSYVMKSEKYKDYTGTLYIFLFLGIVGIIFVILNITKVLTLLNGFFPNLIMGSLFVYFIYEAISTGIKAKELKAEAEVEEQMTVKINSWLKDTVTEDFLASISSADISKELDYIKKTDTIRDMLLSEFEEVDREFLDHLIEEFYSETFDINELYTEEEL